MLGLSDKGRIFDLLEHVLRGDAGAALTGLGEIHRDGADPAQVLTDLADAVHAATRAKIAGESAAGDHLSAEEKRRAAALSTKLSIALLSRAWQMLLKGLEDTANAPDQLAAAEMVLVRLAYAADLPPPGEIVRALGDGRAAGAGLPADKARSVEASSTDHAATSARQRVDAPTSATSQPALPSQKTEQVEIASFADLVAFVAERRDARLKVHLEEYVRVVRFEPGQLELRLLDGAPAGIANDLSEKLNRWTGQRWMIVLSNEEGEPSLGEVRRKKEADELASLQAHPAVAAVLKEFPDAVIRNVRPLRQAGKDGAGAE